MSWWRCLAGCALLCGCPSDPEVQPAPEPERGVGTAPEPERGATTAPEPERGAGTAPEYPWRALGPAIEERLPWVTLVQEERPCENNGAGVLVLNNGLVSGARFAALNQRVPRGYVRHLWVFRASEHRAGRLAGWVYLVDGASFDVECATAIETVGELPAAFWTALSQRVGFSRSASR